METPVIKYNLKDRGRSHSGIPREFDIPKLVAAINSPECQERVKNRDMLGFYGHWPRVKFGLAPAEGGLDKGKAIVVEPALITTYLRAYPNGNVEHKAEFIDTTAGALAEKLWRSKVGGFSSAVDTNAPKLYGFDYVGAPNFTNNRGYAFDSAYLCPDGICSAGMTQDDIDASIYGEQLAGMMMLLDSANQLHDGALLSIKTLEEELAGKDKEIEKLALYLERAKQKSVLDSAYTRSEVDKMISQARSFHSAKLPKTDHQSNDHQEKKPNPFNGLMLKRWR